MGFGWFLLDAGVHLEVGERLRGVREVMINDYPGVNSRINLPAFADGYLLRSGQRGYVAEKQGCVARVVSRGRILRLLQTPTELQA